MKNTFLITTICFLFQIANAQKPAAILKNLDLNGKVKVVTEFIFSDIKDQIDTLHRDTLYGHGKREIKFDNRGNAQYEFYFESNGRISRKGFFKYNTNKSTITIEHLDLRNHLMDTMIYKYNKQGEVAETDNYGVFGVFSKSVFHYDESGNVAEKENYIRNVLNTKVFGKYDERGNEIEQDFYSGDKLLRRVLFTYNLSDGLVSEEDYDVNGFLENKSVFNYSNFDQNGNWQLKTTSTSTYSNNHGHQVSHFAIKRSIEYY
jgi:hypothetical protein